MAAKKYYWLKLMETFFEEDTIAWLEEQENGVYYTNFYLKLCLKSLKSNGILIRNVGEILIPYDIKKLAEITHVSVDTAIVAMELFKKIGLVEILENGEIYLTQLELMVGKETSKAEIMRKKRKREKQIKEEEGNNVTKVLPKCYTEIDKDIEIEKDIEKDKDTEDKVRLRKEKNTKKKEGKVCGGSSLNKSKGSLEERKTNNSNDVDDNDNSKDSPKDYVDYGEEYSSKIRVFKHFEKCGFIVTRQLMNYITEDINTYGEEWVIEAANECVARNKADNYGYLTGILQRWRARGKIERSLKESRANDSAYDPIKSILD